MDASRLAARFLLASLALAPLATVHAADVPPAEAFGALPAVDDVGLSPNGKLLAWSQPGPTGPQAVIYDLDAHANKRVMALDPKAKLRSLIWADNETLLINASVFATYGERAEAAHYEIYRTFAADVNTGKSNMLLMGDGARPRVTGSTLLAWRTPKPKTVIMSTRDFSEVKARQQTGAHLTVGRKDEGWVSFVFEVDTRTGKGSRIQSGTAFTHDWVANRNGEPVARAEWNPASSLFTIEAKGGGSWKEIFRTKDEGTREVYGLTSDEKNIVISSTSASGRRGLWTLPLDGSSQGAPLLEDEKNDVTDITYDRITLTPVSASLGGADRDMRWLDKDAEKRFRRIAGAFKGKRVSVYGRSEDGTRVLAHVDAPSSPSVYYFVDFAKGTADTVGEAYPALIDAKLGDVKIISYTARDGTEVPAYLTTPPGSDG